MYNILSIGRASVFVMPFFFPLCNVFILVFCFVISFNKIGIMILNFDL
jgi:hypothetical protein